MDKALEFIKPLCIHFDVDGVPVTVSPIVVGELPGVIAALEPIYGELELLKDLFARLSEGTQTSADLGMLADLIVNHGQRVIEAVALCCRQPAKWVSGLLLDRLVELLSVCIKVNADFFSRAMPALRAPASPSVGDAAAATTSTGQPPSSS